MIEQLKTIREALNECPNNVVKAHIALAQLEAMVGAQEPVGWVFRRSLIQKFRWRRDKPVGQEALLYWEPVYTAAPAAQQYEAGDVASAAAQGFRDGVASVTQQEPVAWMGIPVMPGRYKEAVFCSDKDLASQWDYSGHTGLGRLIVTPLYATPPAQQPQYEAGDMASAAAQGFRDGVASVAQQPQAEKHATMAGLESSINILSSLVDEQRQLLAEVDAVFGVDAHGIVLEDGDSALIDRVRAHLAATNEPKQPQADSIPVAAYDRLQALCDSQAQRIIELEDKQPQAEAVQACGHPMSLLLRSAESNEPLYCEACDDKSGRHDAERRETELLDANRRLQEKIGSADALKLHAIEELCQLGYTVKDGELFPPDHLHKLMEAANHPLCGKQTEAVPSSALNPDESDSVTLWAEIWRLREAVKGPDGYATWQDAATAERIRRVRAESKQAEASALIERMADALRSCSGVPHWPSFQPLINEDSKWKAEAVPPTHVLVPVEPTEAMEMAWDDAHGDGAPFHSMYAAMLAAAKKEAGHE